MLMRPSYVLGGRAMEIVDSEAAARQLYHHGREGLGRQPGADRPVSARCRSSATSMRCATASRSSSPACMQHIEEAGVHSGDSACTLPPYSLPAEIIAEMERQAEALARGLERARPDEHPVRGEGWRGLPHRGQPARVAAPCLSSPRRIGQPVAKIAARVMAGEKLADLPAVQARPAVHGGKGSGVPVQRASPASIRCSAPKMKSTGEVMGIDSRFPACLRQGPARCKHARCRIAARCSSQ
ncbi:MAG: hypothetical protein QM808_06175 [Steroidobacteraceae bacterium]